MYGSGCWCMPEKRRRKEDAGGRDELAAEKIGEIYRKDKIRNEATRKELGLEMTLVDKIRERRFKHVTRMEGKRVYPP